MILKSIIHPDYTYTTVKNAQILELSHNAAIRQRLSSFVDASSTTRLNLTYIIYASSTWLRKKSRSASHVQAIFVVVLFKYSPLKVRPVWFITYTHNIKKTRTLC